MRHTFTDPLTCDTIEPQPQNQPKGITVAIDPYPSNRHDPSWDAFTAAHEQPEAPPVPKVPPPGIPQLDVASLIETVTRTQQIQSAITNTGSTRIPLWAKGDTAKVAYWATVIPTLVTGCANLAVHQWGMAGPGWTGSIMTGLSVALGIAGMNHHWDMKASALLLGLTVGSISFTTAATGSGWMDVVAWLTAAAGTVGFKIVWNRKHAADRAKIALTEAKIRTEQLKGDAVRTKSAINDAYTLHKLQEAQRAAMAVAMPIMSGATAEERALRCAVWEVFQKNLISCDVRFTRTGYVATVGLPTELPRNDARNAWHKVSNALRLDGRMKVADGRLTNELMVSYVSNDAAALAPLTGWKPGDSWAVVADTGEEIAVPLGRRILFAGTSGSGKSWSARPLMAEASEYEDHRLVLIDLKVIEARNWQHRARIAFDPEHVDQVTAELIEEGERRLKLIPRGRDTIALGNGICRITVFVDEGGELIANLSNDTMDRLRTIARKYRAAEINLVWCTQKPALSGDGHGLDSQISAQMTQRLSLAVATPSESRVVFGEDAGLKGWDAHELPMKGWALLRDIETQSEPQRLRMRAISPADVIELPDRPIWYSDGDRFFSGDSQYLALVDAGEATPADMVADYMAANPGTSGRAAAKALGMSETTFRRALKGS